MCMMDKKDGDGARQAAVLPWWKRSLTVAGCLALYVCVFFMVAGVLYLLLGLLRIPGVDDVDSPTSGLLVAEAVMLLATLVAVKVVYELRRLPLSHLGLSLKGRLSDMLAAFGVAIGLYAVGFGLSCLCGWVRVTDVVFNPSDLLVSLLFFLLVGLYEEITVRGFVLGSLLDAGMNRYVALVLTSLLFSAMHLGNPGLGVLPLLNLALAGLLLGASYIYTRNLWFPVVLHWFWNYLQGPVLGYEVSGKRFSGSLLHLEQTGSSLLTGGNFGFEGSLLCTVLLLAGTACVIFYYERRVR